MLALDPFPLVLLLVIVNRSYRKAVGLLVDSFHALSVKDFYRKADQKTCFRLLPL